PTPSDSPVLPGGRPRVTRLPAPLLPSPPRGFGKNFGWKVTGPASVPAIEITSAWPAAVPSFLSPGTSRAFSFTPCTSAQVGKKQTSHWAWQPRRLVLPHASCGLTGLLNPTAIWHKDYFNRIS